MKNILDIPAIFFTSYRKLLDVIDEWREYIQLY